MVHFLRDTFNKTFIECSVYNNDLSSAMYVQNYSENLIDLYKKDMHESFIKDINDLYEIRGWWWEQAKDSGKYKSIDDFVKEKFIHIAQKYGFNYVTD
jgi:hypothetical protein